MDEQYRKAKEYKKNLCQYPSIDFCNITHNALKSMNKLQFQKNGNIFNEIRFIPFISFDELLENNKNKWKQNNKPKNCVTREDDRIKRKKEKKKEESRKKE